MSSGWLPYRAICCLRSEPLLLDGVFDDETDGPTLVSLQGLA